MEWPLALTRTASAVVFVAFGVGKFVNHASETASFHSYGLPVPGAFTVVIGVLELLGGLLLLAGLATPLIALLLAGDMIGAIVVSGIQRGETVSLTLAPALLVAMAAMIGLGPGRLALEDRRGAPRSQRRQPP
jgi:putative oxidoreductase